MSARRIAATPVTTNSSGEDSQPLTPPTILSMSVTTETNAGVLLLKAAPGATGSYTVTVSDGLGGTQTFTVKIGTNSYDPPNPWVQPILGTDQVNVAANSSATFTVQGESADGTPPQVNVQLFRCVPAYTGDFADSSYVLIGGTFKLQVGSVTTGSITFDSSDMAGTATNIQNALLAAGFSGATVSAVAPTTNDPLAFSFNVTFAGTSRPSPTWRQARPCQARSRIRRRRRRKTRV